MLFAHLLRIMYVHILRSVGSRVEGIPDIRPQISDRPDMQVPRAARISYKGQVRYFLHIYCEQCMYVNLLRSLRSRVERIPDIRP